MRSAIGTLSAFAESGSETRVRRYLERKGVTVKAQVRIDSIGRVDLVVGNSLIIECDSMAHHGSVEGYHRDRERDANALQLGYRVLRLTWEQIWLRWDETKQLLDQLTSSRFHRRLRLGV